MDSNFHFILGSGSPRRKQLLEGIGYRPEVRLKEIPEDYPIELKKEEIVDYLSKHKANAYLGELKSNELLLTADTIVWCDQELLGKPTDRDNAIQMLLKLQGRDHQVYTGVCLSSSTKSIGFYDESTVWFKPLSKMEIVNYVDHYKPFDKAGAYGAQDCLPVGMNPCSEEEKKFLVDIGQPDLFERSLALDHSLAIPIIDRITGSYFNVMGLPIVRVWKELNKFMID
ncbi:MAG: Maf family protein [Bacteroidetes bacterium]|jgi:septum formation protein|nr:Maf family protein [Bacteroidota bacterium]MBP6400921.1 Maf family protein [Bacteroidia bacterium]MBK6838551.1 Maf family protein [Bacteroidota bacterium]MBK9524822.1 Maf family protein [Bacteroidota bacterium]MBK9542988.1 Maf family protein [Bacteroidota bacterium]